MAYGTDLVEVWRRLADDVHKLLNGGKPGDIPIYQPTKFEFVVNLKGRQGAWSDDPTFGIGPRRRGHRITGRPSLLKPIAAQ